MTESNDTIYALVGRAADREPCRIRARYRVVAGVISTEHVAKDSDVYHEGWIINRSPLGVLLEVSHSIPEGRQIELSFLGPDLTHTCLGVATVCWSRTTLNSKFHVGLRFDSLHRL